MEKFICAFSSNYRELYKADIYKILAMPNDFIIHFRYKLKYIEQTILINLSEYLNKDVLIFYSINNNTNNKTENIPVRRAKLINSEITHETDLFHAYLKLGDFCSVTIDSNTTDDMLPSKLFFSNIKCEVVINQWSKTIDNLKTHFPHMCFYHVKSIKNRNGNNMKVKNGFDNKSSYYELNHGEKYIAELSIANPNGVDCKLRFTTSSEDISANIPDPIEITAQYDDITIPIYLKSLNVSSESSFISFIPVNENKINSEYTLNIEIEKTIGYIRPLLFGIFSLITVASIWVIKDNSDSITTIGKLELLLNYKLILACLLLLFSSAALFSQFNKK